MGMCSSDTLFNFLPSSVSHFSVLMVFLYFLEQTEHFSHCFNVFIRPLTVPVPSLFQVTCSSPLAHLLVLTGSWTLELSCLGSAVFLSTALHSQFW